MKPKLSAFVPAGALKLALGLPLSPTAMHSDAGSVA